MSTGLRDHLLEALSRHPGRRTFHVHVLVSAPEKTSELYPYATPRVRKVYLQQVLVILSEEEEGKARVIVAGIEAAVYRIPQTSSGILYVSKVDSTGQAAAPSPTGLLVRSFVGYYVNPKTRPIEARYLWVQLFARAQEQYLFLGSKEWKGKKALGDVKLCGWWKTCLERVVEQVEGDEDVKVKMYYVLPGYSEREAEEMIRNKGGRKWEYGHPYDQTEVPMPCPEGRERPLGRTIPHFEDDAKSRFLDEMGSEMERVSNEEFWERMSFRQECAAGAVTGYFTVVVWGGGTRPGSETGQVSRELKKRIMGMLGSGMDFSSPERAARATAMLERMCDGFGEVHGTVGTNNDVIVRKAEEIIGHQLEVRRKRRRVM